MSADAGADPAVLVGVALALAATTADNVGIVLQAAQARLAPPELSLRLGLVRELMRMRQWLLGSLLVAAGVVIQTVALGFAPLALVQATIGFGVIVLAYASNRVLGLRLTQRQLLAAGLLIGAIVGIAVLSAPPVHRPTNWAWLGVISAVAGLAAAVPYVVYRRHGRLFGATGLAVGAGAAYAGCAVLMKAIADAFSRDAVAVVPVLAAMVAALGLAGFLLEETALRAGTPTTVNPIIMLFQIGVPIALGPLAFGETVQPGVKGVLLVLCFAVAVLAAVTLARATGGVSEGPHPEPRPQPEAA